VIGLFLQERISPGKGLMRTVDDIKEQNGLVYLPHPLSISRESILNVPLIKSILWKIDIVEVFNSRTKRENSDNRWFQDWVESGRVIRAVGSDAHAPHEFGNVFIEMDDFETKEGFLQSLSKARFRIKKTSPMFRLIMNHKSRKIIRLYLSLFRSH